VALQRAAARRRGLSRASRRARLDWLPSSEWVMSSWLPYDEARLYNHVIFHVFHAPAIADNAKTVFGLRPATFRHLRDSGLSPARS
jgi:hypothetical protein